MNATIRPWQHSDAAAIATIINNKKIQNNLRDGIPFPYTKQDGIHFINDTLHAPLGSIYSFAILVDGQVAGSIGAFRQDNIHCCTAEMGYYIAEKYWGKNVCTHAVMLTCQYVFEHSDIIRIYAEPFADNIASCRVLEKAGFEYEGLLRSNAIKNGRIIDMKIYGLIRRTADHLPEMTLIKLQHSN
jgi:RimJ/RimL family protein N-acetyltransferase